MSVSRLIAWGVLALLAAAPAAAANYRFQQIVLEDKNGFEGPIPAISLLIPAGWSWNGAVVWGEHGFECSLNSISVHLEAVSPDRRYALYMRPGLGWTGDDSTTLQYPGADVRCPVKPLLGPRQVLEMLYLQPHRPGAQVLGYRDAPDVAALATAKDQIYDLGYGSRVVQQVRAGEMRLGYNVGGVDYEELIRGVTLYIRNDTAPQYGLPGISVSTVVALPVLVLRAPAGQIDPKVMDIIGRSAKPVPVWQRAYNEHLQAMNRINTEGARQRAAITAKTSAEISEIISSGYAKRTQIMDRMAENTANAILEQGRYADPNTGQEVFLPYHYQSYWKAEDGTYIVTDDANFEPYRDMGIGAQRLEPTW